MVERAMVLGGGKRLSEHHHVTALVAVGRRHSSLLTGVLEISALRQTRPRQDVRRT